MRYLIIGGTSIFGEGLVDILTSKATTERIILTKLPNERKFTGEKIEWCDLDVRVSEDVNQLIQLANADIVFDFAVQDSVGNAWLEPIETVNINVGGTINILNAMRDHSPNSRIVIAGSGEEYGRMKFSDIPICEEVNPQPNNIFGATKACQTMFAKLYHQAFSMDVVVVRSFYEISIQQDERFAVSSFCRQFAEMESNRKPAILHVGNLNNIRDFTDVDDIVRGLVAVSERGKSGEVYNAARGEATTLLDVIRVLEKLTGIHPEIIVDGDRFRPMDAPAVVADVRKIERDCGWKAEIPLEATLAKMLCNWRQKLK